MSVLDLQGLLMIFINSNSVFLASGRRGPTRRNGLGLRPLSMGLVGPGMWLAVAFPAGFLHRDGMGVLDQMVISWCCLVKHRMFSCTLGL